MTTQFEREAQTDKQRQYEGAESVKDGVKHKTASNYTEHKDFAPPTSNYLTASDEQKVYSSRVASDRALERLRPWWWRRLSLRTKATTVAVALSTIPIILLGATAYHLTNQNLTRSITQQQQAHAVSLANKLDRFMLERYTDIQTLAGLSILTNRLVRENTSDSEKQAVLAQYIQTNPGYSGIAVIDLDGDVIVQSSGENITNYSKVDYFQQALKTNRPVITPPRKSLTTNDYAIFAAAPVRDTVTGRTTAIVQSRTPLQYFNQTIQAEAKELAQNVQGFGTEEYLAINEQGTIFVAPPPHTEYIGKNAQSIFPNATARLRAADTVGSVLDFEPLEQEEYLVSNSLKGA